MIERGGLRPAAEFDVNAITDAGEVGVWTKADARSLFDDFKVSGK
jgi:hypothetical protein